MSEASLEEFDLHWERGSAFYKARQFAEAAAEWQEAIRLKPDSDTTYINLAYALSAGGSSYFPEALVAVRTAIRLNSDNVSLDKHNASLYRYLGYNLFTKADESKDKAGWEEAFIAFQRSIDLDPTNKTARHSLGVLHWRLGRKREAVAALKAAVAVNPNDLELLNELGKRQARMGNLRGAIQTIRAINVLPESEEVRRYFANLDQCRKRCQFLLSLGAGLAIMLAGVRIWYRRRR